MIDDKDPMLDTLERLVRERMELAEHTHAIGGLIDACPQCARKEELDRLLGVKKVVRGGIDHDEIAGLAAVWASQADPTLKTCGVRLQGLALQNMFVKATLVASLRESGLQRVEVVRELDALKVAAQAFVDKLAECQPHIDGQFALTQMRSGNRYTGPNYVAELAALKKALGHD
jgi:hypothetical protein